MSGEIDAGLLHQSMKAQSTRGAISAESLSNFISPVVFQFCRS